MLNWLAISLLLTTSCSSSHVKSSRFYRDVSHLIPPLHVVHFLTSPNPRLRTHLIPSDHIEYVEWLEWAMHKVCHYRLYHAVPCHLAHLKNFFFPLVSASVGVRTDLLLILRIWFLHCNMYFRSFKLEFVKHMYHFTVPVNYEPFLFKMYIQHLPTTKYNLPFQLAVRSCWL